MDGYVCRGLPADWLNAWLAAIGSTVLCPDLRLSWTDDPVPVAVLHSPEDRDPAEMVAAAWPESDDLASMPIARSCEGSDLQFTRKVTIELFQNRARLARQSRWGWSLSSTVTDLEADDRELAHARFDPPAPQGLTLHDRLLACHAKEPASADRIRSSLDGRAPRVALNGLGFDVRRAESPADAGSKLVDPVVEVLAFMGLALFPVRGDGAIGSSSTLRQRGWSQDDGRARFRYPTWLHPLDCWGIDALLDAWLRRDSQRSLGVSGVWTTVEYRPRGSADVTKGYASQRDRR